MHISNNPYQNLANAIIIQAVTDYKKALEKLPRSNSAQLRHSHKRTIVECERFFKSEWFCQLNNFDGVELMNRVKKEVLYESTTHTTNRQPCRKNKRNRVNMLRQ